MCHLISPQSWHRIRFPKIQICHTTQSNSPESKYGKIIFNMPERIPIRSLRFSGLVASHSDKSFSQKVVLRYLTLYAVRRPCKKGSPHIGTGIPSEISYWSFCAGWQIHRGISRGTPTLLCQINQQYLAAKNGRF